MGQNFCEHCDSLLIVASKTLPRGRGAIALALDESPASTDIFIYIFFFPLGSQIFSEQYSGPFVQRPTPQKLSRMTINKMLIKCDFTVIMSFFQQYFFC